MWHQQPAVARKSRVPYACRSFLGCSVNIEGTHTIEAGVVHDSNSTKRFEACSSDHQAAMAPSEDDPRARTRLSRDIDMRVHSMLCRENRGLINMHVEKRDAPRTPKSSTFIDWRVTTTILHP
ncbi:hypothetical protein B5807_00092 [Epicoccum nigrum]|uniref:Uncharacterized protein n=1 Tax=Epicoccum nigrum TaxID=105696 RepID=A0A1Y2MFQ3_EPING|nr:hypothetical protein B5807_00092 [Epicoccum nigrum]